MDDTRYYETSCKWKHILSILICLKTFRLPYGITPAAKGRPFITGYGSCRTVVYGTPEEANANESYRKNYKEDTCNDTGIDFTKADTNEGIQV